jgi:hypothetical protein
LGILVDLRRGETGLFWWWMKKPTIFSKQADLKIYLKETLGVKIVSYKVKKRDIN